MKSILTNKLQTKLKKDDQVVAVLIYGSSVKNKKYNDIDVCIMLDKKYPPLQLSKKKLAYATLAPSNYDIQIFQQLPLFIRQRVIAEGEIVYCAHEDAMYNLAFATLKEFDLYEKVYNLYLENVKNG